MKNVLIIDDNSNIANMLGRALTLEGFTTVVSNDGKNSLVLLQTQTFDSILLDISMPGFSGFDFLHDLDSRNALDKQHIIVLTASDLSKEESDYLQSKKIGALQKPVSIELLINLLTSHVSD